MSEPLARVLKFPKIPAYAHGTIIKTEQVSSDIVRVVTRLEDGSILT